MMAVFCYCSVRGYQFTKTVRCLFNVHFPRLQKDYRVPSQCFRLKIEQTIDWKYMFKYSNYETTTLISYRNYANVRDHEGNEDDIAKESETILSDKSYIEISKGIFSIPGVGHRILLVHPVVKSRTRIPLDVGQRQIAEAVALVETLSNWKVIDQVCVCV